MENKVYISLERLTGKLGLPKSYIKRLADENKIPHLYVSGRLRFNPEKVQSALDGLAIKGVDDGR